MGQKKGPSREPLSSEPGGTRTPNRLIRSQKLYPIKLLVLRFLTAQNYCFIFNLQTKKCFFFVFVLKMLSIIAL